ncbi:hypothetical protein ACFRAQ_15870 [Nocardia sp. NPDC056611]|uniref:hypothetical protein n=1 Tax=Nocardia sp. NPDC056611 TaxID=3345877 RepID=UPI00366A8720
MPWCSWWSRLAGWKDAVYTEPARTYALVMRHLVELTDTIGCDNRVRLWLFAVRRTR